MVPKLIVDLRYTATFESNSANAAKAAASLLNAKAVLLEALFCDWGQDGNIVFCPIHRPEYRELEKTEGTLWRNKYPKDLLPNFSIVQSLQIIRELEEIWVLFAFNSSYFERALRVLWKSSNQDNRFIALAENALRDKRRISRVATRGSNRERGLYFSGDPGNKGRADQRQAWAKDLSRARHLCGYPHPSFAVKFCQWSITLHSSMKLKIF